MRNLLALLLLVAPCFSAHAQLGELVGEVFLTYETCFTTVEIDGCTIGESYILQAEGLYTVRGCHFTVEDSNVEPGQKKKLMYLTIFLFMCGCY